MEPNDLPIVVLPTELSGESAAAFIDFLHGLIEALERLYFAQIREHERQRHPQRPPPSVSADPEDASSDDTPF
jgi:hypothetical protein